MVRRSGNASQSRASALGHRGPVRPLRSVTIARNSTGTNWWTGVRGESMLRMLVTTSRDRVALVTAPVTAASVNRCTSSVLGDHGDNGDNTGRGTT